MRVLVTGAGGFVGPWLLKDLQAAGHEPIATGLDLEINLDVCNFAQWRAVVDKLEPGAIINLAGQSSPASSLTQPMETMRVNLLGTVLMLEAVRAQETRCIVIGSAYQYAPSDHVLREDDVQEPATPYGASKAAAEIYALECVKSLGADVVATRSFNQCGPGQSAAFAIGAFCKQIVDIEMGKAPPVLNVGGLSAERDFLDVRDAAAAYRLLLERGKFGEVYNVCSGESATMLDLLYQLLDIAGLTGKVEEVQKEGPQEIASRVRIGANDKICEHTGWSPKIPIEQTLRDTLNWYRQQ